MKTIQELEEIRRNTWDKVNPGRDRKYPRIVVGMATCGIAAGAKPVLSAILEEIRELNIREIEVRQTGCIGICKLEPVVEVYIPGEEKVTYVKMNAARARRIIREHVAGGTVIDEYTMHVVEGKVLNDYTVIKDV
ncbi:MAG: (2Fe-2S) ferredoxin domain-containing protein [Bacillota bacterium]|nr:(2Fe-2S) ferredoxin domain-containing protein [Bacillota bacterium]